MHLLWLWLPVALDAGLIFYLSSIPQLVTPPGPFSDKHFHGGSFALLAALLVRALAGGRVSGITARVAFAAFLLAAIYGATDEFHQMFVAGREASVADLVADALGAAAAAGVLLAWAIIRRQRRVV